MFVERIGDVEFWRPYVTEVLRRHGEPHLGDAIMAGVNATHPTFICGDVVVKIFGADSWRKAYRAEQSAYHFIGTDSQIAAPRLLGAGKLFESEIDGNSWPYLVTTRVHGVPWHCTDLSDDERRNIAAELGHQVKRIHALRPLGVATEEDWPVSNIAAANAKSSLPLHLVSQIDDFLARLAPFDRVVTHSDIVANHVFIEQGQLTGIIDWGDAMVMDRHYEIIQPHRDMFDCDRALLRIFLDASDWPVRKNFHLQALGLALYRQAIGLMQHRSMDVFEPIAARFPLNNITTLDELARELFQV